MIIKKVKNRFVEVKTNKQGWVVVELIQACKNGKITIKMPDGQIIKRKNKNVRSVSTLILGQYTSSSKYWKKFKTKKKRRKVLGKGPSKRFKKLVDKWKDPKIPKMPRGDT